jgi:hypothetical protein
VTDEGLRAIYYAIIVPFAKYLGIPLTSNSILYGIPVFTLMHADVQHARAHVYVGTASGGEHVECQPRCVGEGENVPSCAFNTYWG